MKREGERTGVFTRRALLLMGGQVAVLGALGGAALPGAGASKAPRYTTMANENRISARMIAPPRGRILDRFGTCWRGNITNWRAVLVAEQAERRRRHAGRVLASSCRISDHERARIDRELHRHRRFIPVLVREFLTWDEMAAIEVNAPDLPGIVVDVGTTRQYPFGDEAGARRRLCRAAERGRCGRRPAAGAARHAHRPRRDGEVPRPRAARPGRRGAAGGECGRPGDPRAGPAGGRCRARMSA